MNHIQNNLQYLYYTGGLTMDNSTPIYLVRAMCKTKDMQMFLYKQCYLPVRQDFIQPIQYLIYPPWN